VADVTGPIDGYLRELAASLRTPQPETRRILAEAEDHLHESMAAGLAAGLTETEAAEAAISSFGSVRAVVRAHQTRRGQAAIVLDRLARTVWGAAAVVALSLSAVVAVVLVVAAVKGLQHPSPDEPTPAVALVVASGPAGAALIGGYLVTRCLLRDRRERRRISRG
jgi:HAAS domain-containing protein